MRESKENAALRRPLWREQWLSMIHEFSDRDRQRRIWLNQGDGSEMGSFTELYCCYFDDLGFWRGGEALVEEGYLSAEELAVVLPLHVSAKKYQIGSPLSDDAIIDDPKWANVVDCAKRVRGALLTIVKDPVEADILAGG